MKRILLLTAMLALVTAPSLVAQSKPAAPADPVSGTWMGIPSDGAALMLKFDGKKTVSGSIGTPSGPAPIKIGTFDRKTGALRLEGEAKMQDGAMAKYVIEGKIEKGTVSGTYAFGNEKGTFKMSRK